MMSSSLIAIKKADSVPALPLCSTDSWHMPDVCPAASSLLDLEAVFCGESPSFREIGLPGITRGLLHKSGYIPGGFFDHGSPQIRSSYSPLPHAPPYSSERHSPRLSNCARNRAVSSPFSKYVA